ncbi:prenyltransferase/squalene oxidase repeat-containing protein [Planctomicrobium piriforme]|uniref:Prenyltransferase and squalene oxidase repeat-containing protein n=1 Tax=Planctomicrobium piriforme TaxID=1576369 RepID=A0A1I3NCZ8_9PLAN|nr:hypothetical protein [Planctomicrobium piriforme]SFJ07183.1 hypothetical protein SAMN05421753_11565 [Planctomicrobium piriforme]
MILAALSLEAEVWHMLRLAIALLQPLLVLGLIAGMIIATGHLLTMIGTRWGDHRASSKAMFFSVAMHLLLVGSLIALIPEYRAMELLHMVTRDLEPIRVSVPNGNSKDSEHATDDEPVFDVAASAFRAVASKNLTERDRMEAQAALTEQPLPLEKPTEPVPFEPAMVKDREQPEEKTPAPPEASPAPEFLASRMEPQAGPDIKAEALPQQQQNTPGDGRVSSIQRSVLPTSEMTASQAVQRPQTGSADRVDTALAPDRQASEAMVVPVPEAASRQPDAMSSARSDQPAPVGSTPQMLGQATPAEVPKTPDPQRGRLETRALSTGTETSGIGRLRPRSMDLPAGPVAATRGSGVENRADVLPEPVERPQLSRVENPFRPQNTGDRVPSAYRLRSEEERGKAVLKFGGSQATEDAVDRSLRWMASVQNPAGYWHAGDYSGAGSEAGDASHEADVGITSLAVLAFLGKLNTVEQGEYSPVVNRALNWIVSQQTRRHWGEGWGSTDGYLGGSASEFEAMYCHAMATFALAEAYAMSRNHADAQWLRTPLVKAVGFILDTQNVDGGWRYVKGQREGDMSIFGWQLMALKSAQAAGIEVDERRIARMRRFLAEQRIGSSGGLAGYRPREAASASASAESLYCRQMLGMADEAAANDESVKVILANLPRRTTLNYYYWYYGTLALYQHGGAEWEQWNTAVRNMLVAEQRRSGPLSGSWDPHDVWGGYGGRMYSTAIATLSLEVYYRYLPIYRLNEAAP